MNAENFHLVSTAVFVLGSAVVSARLLALARQTREEPELLLGLAILCTAVLGYGVLIASLVVRLAAGDGVVPPVAIALTGAGKLLHDVGVTCFLAFVLAVFRPHERWARALAAAAALSLWGGMLWGVATGSLERESVGSAPWLAEYVVIWSYPLWLVAESLRYWRRMRRRAAVGLGEPMVANRFLLWGVGSLFTAIAIWTASAPFLFADDPATLRAMEPPIHVATAIAGLVSVGCSYLAFLPPQWLRTLVERRAAASVAKAD